MIDLASKVEDYQMILKTLTVSHGWSCDPGSVDNANGPKTKASVKAFQEEYNSRCSGTLKADGIIGPKTWSALFTVIRSGFEATYKAAAGDVPLPSLVYGYSGKGVYPCGESFPVDSAEKDNCTSSTNRRVEMVFFDKGTKANADGKTVYAALPVNFIGFDENRSFVINKETILPVITTPGGTAEKPLLSGNVSIPLTVLLPYFSPKKLSLWCVCLEHIAYLEIEM